MKNKKKIYNVILYKFHKNKKHSQTLIWVKGAFLCSQNTIYATITVQISKRVAVGIGDVKRQVMTERKRKTRY